MLMLRFLYFPVLVAGDSLALAGLAETLSGDGARLSSADGIYDIAADSEDFTFLGKRKRRNLLFFVLVFHIRFSVRYDNVTLYFSLPLSRHTLPCVCTAVALDRADLAGILSGDWPLTVFAPTNAAFDALPDNLRNKLADPVWKPQQQIVSCIYLKKRLVVT